MREKYIEQKLVREVKKRGGLCEKWNSGSSGWPDRLVWVGGSEGAGKEAKSFTGAQA